MGLFLVGIVFVRFVACVFLLSICFLLHLICGFLFSVYIDLFCCDFEFVVFCSMFG